MRSLVKYQFKEYMPHDNMRDGPPYMSELLRIVTLNFRVFRLSGLYSISYVDYTGTKWGGVGNQP